MNVEFAVTRPDTATTIVIPVVKGGLAERIAGEATAEGLRAAASLSRFEGESGTLAEYIDTHGGVARRIVLAGIGGASESDAVKAGSAMTAKLLTSGETALVLDASGIATPVLTRLLEGAVLRGWRYDRYRTRLPAMQKPTLDKIVVAGAGESASEAWGQGRCCGRWRRLCPRTGH